MSANTVCYLMKDIINHTVKKTIPVAHEETGKKTFFSQIQKVNKYFHRWLVWVREGLATLEAENCRGIYMKKPKAKKGTKATGWCFATEITIKENFTTNSFT